MGDHLVEVRRLTTSFSTAGRRVPVITDLSFDIETGEALALVGESGCGKSVTALSLMRLLDESVATIDCGEIHFDGTSLLELSERDMRRVRGARMGMVFQEPMTSLNPVFTIGQQLVEAIMLHRPLSRREARKRAGELLELVQVPSPRSRLDEYPHQLSGGMRQRVMIAMALSCDPQLLIADEPTTALDVTVQAQVLELLRDLQQSLGMAILLITHDLALVSEFAQRVLVMYAGQIVEAAEVSELFRNPRHPYTNGLLESLPARVLARSPGAVPQRLPVIDGTVPTLAALPDGCRFRARCGRYVQLGGTAHDCETASPRLEVIPGSSAVRCHFPLGGPIA